MQDVSVSPSTATIRWPTSKPSCGNCERHCTVSPRPRPTPWSHMSIYNDWGLEPIINASGAVTRLGGASMPEAVLEAFCAAARESVPLDELQAVASRALAEATGAEAGLVTSGAAAALTLGTAAILT